MYTKALNLIPKREDIITTDSDHAILRLQAIQFTDAPRLLNILPEKGGSLFEKKKKKKNPEDPTILGSDI